MKNLLTLTITFATALSAMAQFIPMDTSNWEINARAYVLEKHKGKDAIYLQGGTMALRNKTFENGTIEYDIFLKEEPGFPGVYFRSQPEEGNAEHFYVRPHQSGNPDANQAAPLVQGISPWQLLFGTRYSFPYDYKFDDWTHVKILVNGKKAQVFLDWSETPNLSWDLTHEPKAGNIILTGGNASGLHIANVKVDFEAPEITNFNPIERPSIEGLIPNWQISDMFEEKSLENLDAYDELISARKWQGELQVEEGTAANISRIQKLYDGTPGNTVFAKVEIKSDTDVTRLMEFGYSDRVVVILNGEPLYWGNNKWRSRDYRYLGTIGLFDAVYLKLKKGKNTLLMAVSEDFGGWLVTGKIKNMDGLKVTP